MPNQHLPRPPDVLIREAAEQYYYMNMNDIDTTRWLMTHHIDTSKYGLSVWTYRKMRQSWGLISTRQQKHTTETIRAHVEKLRRVWTEAGERDLTKLLLKECEIKNGIGLMREYFHKHEADMVASRKARKLKRKRFWAAGVNDLWVMDQHDKLQRFGLRLHTGVEPYSGRILWLKVWHTNSDPERICRYYIDTVKEYGFIPLITQSDPGPENFGVANSQTTLRQDMDVALIGTLQHRWMVKGMNVKPEITWSQLRRRFMPGFERILDEGVIEGWYDASDALQRLVFLWLFVPWLQTEIDGWVKMHNFNKKRFDPKKVLPHGRPELIFQSPEEFGSYDFKVFVGLDRIEAVERMFANPASSVHDLVPPPFADKAAEFYRELGQPNVDRDSVWTVYSALLGKFEEWDLDVAVCAAVSEAMSFFNDDECSECGAGRVPLMAGMASLPYGPETRDADGNYYMGGRPEGLSDIPAVEIMEESSGGETDGEPEDELEEEGYLSDYVELPRVCAEFSDESGEEIDGML